MTKRWKLPDQVITHIFEGEPKGNSFSGFHSEAVKSLGNGKMMFDGQPDPEQLRLRMTGQPYKAKVKIKFGESFVRTGGVSTFFPHPAAPKATGPSTTNDSQFPGIQAGNTPSTKEFSKENIIKWIEQALTSLKPVQPGQIRPMRTTGITTSPDLDRIKVNGISCHVLRQDGADGAIASIYPARHDNVNV